MAAAIDAAAWSQAQGFSTGDGVVVWNASHPAGQVTLHRSLDDVVRMQARDRFQEIIAMLLFIWNCYCQVVGAVVMLAFILALTYHSMMLALYIMKALFPSRSGVQNAYLRMSRINITAMKATIRAVRFAVRGANWLLPLVLPSAVLEELYSTTPETRSPEPPTVETYSPSARTADGEPVYRVGQMHQGAQMTYIDFKRYDLWWSLAYGSTHGRAREPLGACCRAP